MKMKVARFRAELFAQRPRMIMATYFFSIMSLVLSALLGDALKPIAVFSMAVLVLATLALAYQMFSARPVTAFFLKLFASPQKRQVISTVNDFWDEPIMRPQERHSIHYYRMVRGGISPRRAMEWIYAVYPMFPAMSLGIDLSDSALQLEAAGMTHDDFVRYWKSGVKDARLMVMAEQNDIDVDLLASMDRGKLGLSAVAA